VCDWINAGSKEVASFVTMLTGSFKAYARIIAEQQAFGIAAQAVFEAPPLPAIRMNQQIKTLSVWQSPGYGSRLFVTNDSLAEAVADVPRSFVYNGKLCLQRGHNRFVDQFVAWPTAAAATPQKKQSKKPVRRSPDGLHMLVAGIGFEPMTFGL
jgi:hypothetical protein